MKEYGKIETLFERDVNGSKKLIEGKFRNPSRKQLKAQMTILPRLTKVSKCD